MPATARKPIQVSQIEEKREKVAVFLNSKLLIQLKHICVDDRTNVSTWIAALVDRTLNPRRVE